MTGAITALTARLPPSCPSQTVFCILAVDYPIFPRRFAKARAATSPLEPAQPPVLSLGPGTAVREQTHTWGHSLMDLGVGAVMLTGALVRRRARAKPAGRSDSAWRVCRRHAPLVAIGVGRLLAVKAADYHEVVTPWAVHRLTPPHTPSGPPTSPPAPSSAPHIAPHTRAGRERVWHPLELLLHARARRGGGGSCDASLGAGHCAVRGRPAPAAPGGAPLRPRAVGRARAAARAPEREQGVARPSTPRSLAPRACARVLSLTSLLPAARGRRQEGLASLPGYLAVWWLGDAVGAVLRPRAAARSWWRALAELGLLTLGLGAGAPRTPPPRARLAPPPTRAVALTPGLAPLCRLLCAASFIADAAVQRASRRLCNLAYSLWVVAQARRAPEPSCTPARPAAVPARHRPSWCCASVSQRASSVQHQLRTSWAR